MKMQLPYFSVTAPVLLSMMLLVSCSGSTGSGDDSTGQEWRSHGEITGIDVRRCAHPCCGGWYIAIDGTKYRFLKFPDGSNPSLQNYRPEDFPIPVKLNWESAAREGCAEDLITVLAIERDE